MFAEPGSTPISQAYVAQCIVRLFAFGVPGCGVICRASDAAGPGKSVFDSQITSLFFMRKSHNV
jgi:hypothetical protein